jgi:uncharacterized protein
LALGLVGRSDAQVTPPAPTQWVTDTSGFLSTVNRDALNTRLESYQRTSGHQLLVWIGKTTGQVPIEDWGVRTFKAWQLGRKGMDDGIVLFIMADDRTARIEVGYGLEGKVPDSIASRILTESIAPLIQTGDRDGAVTAGVDKLLGAIGGEGAPAAPVVPPTPIPLWQQIVLGIFVVIIVALAIRYPRFGFYLIYVLASITGRGSGGGGAGGGGGKSGGGGASGKW